MISKRSGWSRIRKADDRFPFSLEANPYRAALIKFAQDKGEISLTPIYGRPCVEKIVDEPGTPTPRKFSDEASEDYRDEDIRVKEFLTGDYRVGDEDINHILKIQPSPKK